MYLNCILFSKTCSMRNFFFLFSYLATVSMTLLFFSPFTLFSVYINTIDERVQIEKCWKLKRNKDSNSKDKAKQT